MTSPSGSSLADCELGQKQAFPGPGQPNTWMGPRLPHLKPEATCLSRRDNVTFRGSWSEKTCSQPACGGAGDAELPPSGLRAAEHLSGDRRCWAFTPLSAPNSHNAPARELLCSLCGVREIKRARSNVETSKPTHPRSTGGSKTQVHLHCGGHRAGGYGRRGS